MGMLFLHVLNTVLLFLLAQEVQCAHIYVGCYKEIFEHFTTNSVENASQCMTDCRNRLSYFAAVKDGSLCYCANKISARVSLSNCNLPCMDNDGICGGSDFYAVHTGVPAYHGCFKDDIINRDMNLVITGDWDMTIDKCYYYCSQRKYMFMGLQNGGSCFCGDEYGKYGRTPESECNVTCTKNGNQICGGPARNSVYAVEHFPGLNKSYSEMFHCLKDRSDRNGTCPQSKCQPGWKGRKCNHRDCLTNNGDCGEQKCAEIKIGNQNLSECVCKEGFRYDPVKEECLDVDECSEGVCNELTSTCKNTVGSFNCICNEGYTKDSSTKECKDVDECSLNVCNDLTSICTNTFGSYDCVCKEGYAKNLTSGDCEDQNECLLNLCKDSSSICLNTVGSYQCTCKKGFQKHSRSQDCEDEDECTSNPCNLSTSTCKNSVGSYECNCNEGFVRISSSNSDCTDIDECKNNPCNEPSETCINTIGSFMCTCSPGYNYAKQSNCVDCSGFLAECHNSTFCQPKPGYICDFDEIRYKNDGHVGGIKNKKIILVFTTFLAVLVCSLLIVIVKSSLNRKGRIRKADSNSIRFQNISQGSRSNH